MTVAVILAAGKSERMGGGVDKAFLSLVNKPVVAWSLIAFERCQEVDKIVLVVRKDFAEKNPQAVADFLAEYEASVAYCNENLDGAAKLIVNMGILGAEPVAKRAIPNCHVTFIKGEAMKTKLKGYLGTLYEQDPASIGGAMPGDDFYYTK